MTIINKEKIKTHIIKHDILTTSMLWLTDSEREKYYAELEKEDFQHNMEMLFNELRVLREMLHSLNSDLRDDILFSES